MKTTKHFLGDQSGQTMVMAALSLSLLVSFLGLAIDVGHLRAMRQTLQNAADASALAAGLEIRICGASANCSAMQTAAQNSLQENGLPGSTLITNCASNAGTALTIMVNSPPCFLGSRDPNAGSRFYTEVVLSEQATTYFGRIVGFNNVKLSARAEAHRYPGLACIYALDPTAASAIAVDASLASTCPIIDESSSASAFTCLLGATVSAQRIAVTGGTTGLLCNISPKPRTSAITPVPADPLAYLPKPTMPACGTSTASPYHGSAKVLNLTALSGAVILYPDASYCGGINIAAGASVTFQPGTFVIKSNNTGTLGATVGGLSVSLGSTVNGTGVTVYNYGPVGAVTFALPNPLSLLGHVNLTAPNSGTYGGMLFIQDPGDTTAATLLASAAWNGALQGAFYFPTAAVNYAVSGASTYNILVAKDIHFLASAGSNFTSNYSALSSGSPLNGDADVLVQ